MRVMIFSAIFLLLRSNNSAQKLHLFGGYDHEQYLGCLNCNKYDKNSVWNQFGTYGSKFNRLSIWNEFGTYGSKFNSLSPWNQFSNDPPVIVDDQGNFYGFLTLNKYKSARAEFSWILIIYQYYEFIRDDPDKWYDKIFY